MLRCDDLAWEYIADLGFNFGHLDSGMIPGHTRFYPWTDSEYPTLFFAIIEALVVHFLCLPYNTLEPWSICEVIVSLIRVF